MKKGKEWAKSQDHGGMRWVRDGVCLALQWKDNRAVTLLSTINHANEFVMVERRENWQSVVHPAGTTTQGHP